MQNPRQIYKQKLILGDKYPYNMKKDKSNNDVGQVKRSVSENFSKYSSKRAMFGPLIPMSDMFRFVRLASRCYSVHGGFSSSSEILPHVEACIHTIKLKQGASHASI